MNEAKARNSSIPFPKSRKNALVLICYPVSVFISEDNRFYQTPGHQVIKDNTHDARKKTVHFLVILYTQLSL